MTSLRAIAGLLVLACAGALAGCADEPHSDAPPPSKEGVRALADVGATSPSATAAPEGGDVFARWDAAHRASPDAATGTAEIEILHTNDIHGQVYPIKAVWLNQDPPPEAGGLSALATIIRRERADAAAAGRGFLLLDAGDIWQGTPEGNMTEGRVVVHWMNLVGYTAQAVGNHEFDAGADRIASIAAEAAYPWLAANLRVHATGERPAFARAAVDRIVAGAKVTVVGLIADDTRAISTAKATRGFDFLPAVAAAREEVSRARARGAEVVIVLSHCGIDVDKQIAARVEGVDAVIGGHTHQGLDPAFVDPQTGALVAATFSKGTTIGRAVLTLDRRSRKVVEREGHLIQVLTAAQPPDAATDALVERETAAIHAKMSEVLGAAEGPLIRDKGFASSALGNWLCDVMREAAKADVALTNKTGIRADIAAGPVRMSDIYQVSPFGNALVTLTLTGAELRSELEYALSDPKLGLEVAGLEVRYDLERPAGDRVIRARAGGEPLSPEKKYRVVTNSFLAAGGDGHLVLKGGADRRDLDVDVMKLHADDLRRRRTVKPDAELRLGPAEDTSPMQGGPTGGPPAPPAAGGLRPPDPPRGLR